MATTNISVGEFGIGSAGSDRILVTARPDIRIVKLGFLAAVLIAAVLATVYLLPINESIKVAFLPLSVLFIVTLAYSSILFEGLGNAVYTVTKEYVEEQGGRIWKTRYSIPLSYVRDVTYHQNFLQALYGLSSVTISTTNGNKIVLMNIADGDQMREIILSLVLREPSGKQR